MKQEGEKKEIAPEGPVQEKLNIETKCAYLGCHKRGKFLDKVEVAPNKFEYKLVCNKHLGQLIGFTAINGKPMALKMPYGKD